MLQPWGERSIKQFVADAVDESMGSKARSPKLRMQKRIAVLHCAPVHHSATVGGIPPRSARTVAAGRRFRRGQVGSAKCGRQSLAFLPDGRSVGRRAEVTEDQ